MKLFHKIFLCFVLIFGIAFQAAGALLIHFSYENMISQQKKYAFQEFCQNEYILQSLLYFNPDLLKKDGAAAGRFTVPFALYAPDRSLLDADMELETAVDFDSVKEGELSFAMRETEGENFILVYDLVRQGETAVYLVTKTDISLAVAEQKKLAVYFRNLCLVILGVGFPLIFVLSGMLAGSIKKVGRAAKRIAEGSYEERIRVSGQDEVAELAADFNRMAEKVEEKIAELSNVAREKEDFAANFAHELKTPLTSVIGYADMLCQRKLPEEQVKSAAGYILQEGLRLESLSLKLMDLFVLEKQDFCLEVFSVQDMFANLEQGLRLACEKHGARLHLEMEEGRLAADYDFFQTMLLNLADNALKADCRNIWLTGSRTENRYEIKLADDGKGIPKEELGRITEAFYMVDKSRARKQHGAGLGLALVQKIAKLHKASLRIESDGETGTVARLCFPQAPDGGWDEGKA